MAAAANVDRQPVKAEITQVIKESIETYYDIGYDIGSGQYAVVKCCRHKLTGTSYAGKFIQKKRSGTSRRGVLARDIHNEVAILREVNHENIVKLYQVYETQHQVVLVLELVAGGELFHYLARRDRVSEDEAVGFIKQILEGVRHLHERNIVHLDLKPENVILLGSDSTRLKIVDFGLSRKLDPTLEYRELAGTPEFVAPEVINYDSITCATDMWSIGVITYIMLSGLSPFLGADKQETLSNVSAVSYSFDDESFCTTSLLAKDFITHLLIHQPKRRATVYECLRHPWILPRDEKQMNSRRQSMINVINLKSFVARRRWKHWFHVIAFYNHIAKHAAIRNVLRQQCIPDVQVNMVNGDATTKICNNNDPSTESAESH